MDILFDAKINRLKITCTFLNNVTVLQTNNHEKSVLLNLDMERKVAVTVVTYIAHIEQ